MLLRIGLLLLGFSLSLCRSAVAIEHPIYSLSVQIQQTAELPFIKHHGVGRFKNYLAMNISHAPVVEIFNQLQTQRQGKLKNRPEAHITVITPPEFDLVLSKLISIEEIDQIAIQQKIQQAHFALVCLGKVTAKLPEQVGESYFLVIKSPDLIAIRTKIQALYVQKGGAPTDFNPHHFYPHITVGFNPRDLHESDGVLKDNQSCYGQLKVR